MATSEAYPKRARLRRRGEFRRVLAQGAVWAGREALVRAAPNRLGWARLGISTPRRFGGAVARNRFRRLVREAFRRVAPTLGPQDLLVSPRKHLRVPTLEGLLRDLRRIVEEPPLPPRPGSHAEGPEPQA